MVLFCFAMTILSTVLFEVSSATYLPLGPRHDNVKDGRSVDGPFPNNLNIPYYCYQAPEKGPCNEMTLVWFYDVITRQCQRMIYSGCGGNENKFISKGQCENYCGRKRRV